jgi:PiT family inorganic phosphate transporter
MTTVVLLAMLFLAFANGANDNFKGVATLYGSGTASFRIALGWATLTTAAGAMLAPIIAPGLIGVFKAKGLVPNEIAASPEFMASAMLGAAATVATATRFGLPVSTTHALTGGLVGAGLVGAGSALNLDVLGKAFVLPLLAGPFVAAIIAAIVTVVATAFTRRAPVRADACVCVDATIAPQPALAGAALAVPALAVTTGNAATCPPTAGARVTARQALDGFHFLSAGAVGFARGVNDAPKLLALGMAAGALGGGATASVAVVTATMVVGGLLFSRRVAETLSTKMSHIEVGTGVVANTTAATLVILGSLFKLPLSTTHVTTGAIVGSGAARGQVAWRVFGQVALAWITTLPVAVAFGAAGYAVITHVR